MQKSSTHKANDAPSTHTVRVSIADDFRQEQGGKMTAIGLYTDDVVVVTVEPDSPEPSEQTPIVVHSLSALITLIGLSPGKHVIGVEHVDSALKNPPQFGPSREMDLPAPGMSATMVVRFQPFVAGSYGTKHLIVTVDNKSTKFAFEIRRGSAPSPKPSLPQAPAVKGTPLASGGQRRMIYKKPASKGAAR